MHIIHNGETDTFQSLFERNEEIHNHDTRRQNEHCHIPSCKTNFGGKSLKYDVVIWNILRFGINFHISDNMFAKKPWNMPSLKVYCELFSIFVELLNLLQISLA